MFLHTWVGSEVRPFQPPMQTVTLLLAVAASPFSPQVSLWLRWAQIMATVSKV